LLLGSSFCVYFDDQVTAHYQESVYQIQPLSNNSAPKQQRTQTATTTTMMMRFPSILIGLLLVTPALATFHKDVVSSRGRGSKSNSNSNKPSFHHKERDMQNSILSKAMPLADYQAKMGIEPTANANDRRLEDGDDDADQNLYSFSGYSIKYAKCQPVQYFSEDAVAAGMRSPMVTNDIVILRLCPQTSCSQSREYGCVYNYAEYALSMSDYLQIMMEYSQQKKEYTCDYCDACINEERRLEDGDNDEDGNDDADGNDQDNDADAEEDDDEEEGNDDGQAANYDYSQNNNCGDNWDTYCSDYAYMCQDEEDQDQQNGGYNGGYNEYDYDSYEDYMQCAKVNYNDYAYFMKPTCNAYTGVIEFGIYFDDYCSESATSKVSLNKLGLGLSDSIFEEFYSGQCIDCSESVSGSYNTLLFLDLFLPHTISPFQTFFFLYNRTLALTTIPIVTCATNFIKAAPNAHRD
jgi:hypothetical protein